MPNSSHVGHFKQHTIQKWNADSEAQVNKALDETETILTDTANETLVSEQTNRIYGTRSNLKVKSCSWQKHHLGKQKKKGSMPYHIT